MHLHNLLHSDDRRVAKRIIVNQSNGEGSKINWYTEVNHWLVKLDLKSEEEAIMETSKSAWKKVVKEKVEQAAREEVEGKFHMTKLRHCGNAMRKDYVKEGRMEEVKKIMKVRLNMTELKANFPGKYHDRTCPACGKNDETTEHVIQCDAYKKLVGHELRIDKDIKEHMNNTEWLKEAIKVYELIEETRQWIL